MVGLNNQQATATVGEVIDVGKADGAPPNHDDTQGWAMVDGQWMVK